MGCADTYVRITRKEIPHERACSIMTERTLSRVAAASILASGAVALAGCKAPQAFGERHALIVHADTALWAQVEPAVRESLERTVFTTRPERTFELTHVAPDDETWSEFRLFWQVLVIGSPDEEIVADLVGDSDDPDARPPAIVQQQGRWARGQRVTVMLLPEQGTAAAVRDLLPELYSLLMEQYREWVRDRMYTTGVDDSLRQALAEHGFTLDVPRVYETGREDSVFRFRNTYQAGQSDLFRSLLVTWQQGVDPVQPDSLFAWRERLGDTGYDPPQDILQEGLRWDTVTVAGQSTVELRGVYQDRAEFPAAGPFIARAVPCQEQNRTYYMDGWVFAPGTAKYPYVLQLELLMGSFDCAGARALAAAEG